MSGAVSIGGPVLAGRGRVGGLPPATFGFPLASQFTGASQGWYFNQTPIDFTQDWALAVHFGFSAAPIAAQYRTLCNLGDATYSGPWLWVGTGQGGVPDGDGFDGGARLYFEIGGTGITYADPLSDAAPDSIPLPAPDVWHTLRLRYSASTTRLEFAIDGVWMRTGAVVDLTPFNGGTKSLFLGVDESTPTPVQSDEYWAFCRVWQRALTDAEFAIEEAHACPQDYTGLLIDSPLFAYDSTLQIDSFNHLGGKDDYFPYTWDAFPTTRAMPPLCLGRTIPAGSLASNIFDGVVWFYEPTTLHKVGVRTIQLAADGFGGGAMAALPSGPIAMAKDGSLYTADLRTNQGPSTYFAAVFGSTDGVDDSQMRLVAGSTHCYAALFSFPHAPPDANYRTVQVKQLSAAGVETDSWDLWVDTHYASVGPMAVSPDESILYYVSPNSATFPSAGEAIVRRYSLTGSTSLSDLYTLASNHRIRDLVVDPGTGNVIVYDWYNPSPFTNPTLTILCLSPAGSVVWSQVVSSPTRDVAFAVFGFLLPPNPGDAQVWVFYQSRRGGETFYNGELTLQARALSDGSVIRSLDANPASGTRCWALTTVDLLESCDGDGPPEVTFANDRIPGLTHIEITLSDDSIEPWSVIPMDDALSYNFGRKQPRVLAWADIRRSTGDFYGQPVAADFKFQVRDKDLHVLGYLGTLAHTFTNRYTVTRSIRDVDRRLQLLRRIIFRGPIRSVAPRANAVHEFTVKDYLQERFGPNSDVANLPRRKVLKEDFDGCEAELVNSSAEQYVVHGAHPAIVPGGPTPTAYVSDGSTSAGATSMAVRTGDDSLLGTVTFANQPDAHYIILTHTGTTAITFTPALLATVPDGTAITLEYGGAKIAVHSGVGTFAADQIVFGNHATVYTVSASSVDDPETQITISPALTADVPDGTTITQTPTHKVTPSKGFIVPVRGGLLTDRKIITSVDVGDGQGKSIYVGDEVHDDGFTYGIWVWACHGCYAPSGKPLQQVYFWNQALDTLAGADLYENGALMAVTIGTLATEAGSSGRVLLPGYANWTDNGFSGSCVDRHGRRYVIYGLRGIFRDWALGIRAAPQNYGGIPHAVNGYGMDATLDGLGAEVRDLHDQFVLTFNNFLWGDYQSGAPLPDPTFPDDPTLTLLDLASIARAKAHGATLVSGGFRGDWSMGADNQPITMAEAIKRWVCSLGVEQSWNRKTQFMIDRLDLVQATSMADAPTLTDERDIQKGSFVIDEAPTQLFTALPFVHTRDEWGRATTGWRSSTADVNVVSSNTEYADTPAIIARYSPSGAKLLSQPLEFYFLRGKNRSTDADEYQQGSDTINAILAYKLTLAKVRILSLTTWGKGYDIEIYDRLWIRHFANVDGFTEFGRHRTPRPVRVVEHDAQPDKWRVTLKCFDLGGVFPTDPGSHDHGPYDLPSVTVTGSGSLTIGAPSIFSSDTLTGTGSVAIGPPAISGAGGLSGTLVVAWDANPLEDGVTGYLLEWGTASGVYTHSLDVGNVLTYLLTGLTPGTTYYVAIEAYDVDGHFSADSAEVSGVAS